MRLVVKLGLDLVTRAAGAPAGFRLGVPGQRIAALNHEVFDDAMKGRAVVKTLTRELLEIFNRLRRDVDPEFDYHFARGSFDDGDFVHGVPFGLDYFAESAGTILTLSIPMRLSGLSGGCVFVVAIFSNTSSPLSNLPNAVYL